MFSFALWDSDNAPTIRFIISKHVMTIEVRTVDHVFWGITVLVLEPGLTYLDGN